MGLRKNSRYFPYNPALVARAKALRTNMTAAEKKLWFEYLRRFPLKVYRQRPIDHYIVDFFCAKLKLVIEVDGDTHFTEAAQEYDQIRSEILQGYGLKVLRFTNDEVLQNFAAVCSKIEANIPF
ncbi:MAG: endonuclease domain-containing protein [Limnothrix sp. RL_2_0]|nr:endonuclease domain-containing protein [Limnothrix sp. RL_2_0]